jgi:hypothetical protein
MKKISGQINDTFYSYGFTCDYCRRGFVALFDDFHDVEDGETVTLVCPHCDGEMNEEYRYD